MAKNNNGPSYADEKKKAVELGKKRQAKFKEFCLDNQDKALKEGVKLKGCGITPAQKKILQSMLTEGQGAVLRQQQGQSTEAQKAKDKAIIQSKYGPKYGRKKTK